MTQINHVFGDTLEFSTTVTDGKIKSQELVSSSADCLISFKLDKNFLCPKVLRGLADEIDVAKNVKLVLATQDQASVYIKNAKESGVIASGLFASSKTAAYLAIAEYTANIDGFTLYDSRVEFVPEPVVVPDDEDEYEDDDWDEDDDEDPNGYDDEDDYECGCYACRALNEDDDDDDDEDDEDYDEDDEDDDIDEDDVAEKGEKAEW